MLCLSFLLFQSQSLMNLHSTACAAFSLSLCFFLCYNHKNSKQTIPFFLQKSPLVSLFNLCLFLGRLYEWPSSRFFKEEEGKVAAEQAARQDSSFAIKM